MAQPEMSFAQALNEAKGVILQLSNRVKADAEKIRSQQETIAAKAATIAELETRTAQVEAGFEARIKEAEAAGAHAEAILNRQGEKILSLEAAAAEREKAIANLQAQVADLIADRDAVRAQLPSQEDAAALASMAQLLIKAAPAIEKAKKSTASPKMRLAEAA